MDAASRKFSPQPASALVRLIERLGNGHGTELAILPKGNPSEAQDRVQTLSPFLEHLRIAGVTDWGHGRLNEGCNEVGASILLLAAAQSIPQLLVP